MPSDVMRFVHRIVDHRVVAVATVSATRASGTWRAQWAVFTGISALVASAFDTALLERVYGIFSGGFQSTERIDTPAELLAFVGASVLADAGVVALLVGLALWITAHTRLTSAARTLVILAIALGPIFVADFFSYELLSYLGDSFEFWVMFNLAENPRELLAVASGHVVAPVLTVLATLGSVGCVVWMLDRHFPENPPKPAVWASAVSRLVLVAAVGIVGLVTTYLARTSSDALENALRRKPSVELLGRIINWATDIDRDGYGLLSRPGDPDPWNAQVSPYAVDIPGNGIDENGLGGDLPADVASAPGPDSRAGVWQYKPDIVMFLLESVRADIVGQQYDGRPVTPVLDHLARQGVSARYAFSHNGWTIQSRYHLFSGEFGTIPGVRTLVDDFKANGYEVAYFSGQAESFGGPDMDVGFARADVAYDARVDIDRRYTASTSAGSLAIPFNLVQEKVIAFLETRSSTKPLFLYVNFEDTHFPYTHSGIRPLISDVKLSKAQLRPDRATELRPMFLNTVANVDRAIGEVLDKTSQVLGKQPAVIVTSDHGESLFEGGFLGHGTALDDTQTRVPFIAVNLPMVIREPFGQTDFRDALHAALGPSRPVGLERPFPVVKQDDARRVFQYLGTVEQPAQIALTGVGGRMIYDLRRGRVRVGALPWKRPTDLEPHEFQTFQQLVRFWETAVWRGHQGRAARAQVGHD